MANTCCSKLTAPMTLRHDASPARTNGSNARTGYVWAIFGLTLGAILLMAALLTAPRGPGASAAAHDTIPLNPSSASR